jgi:hypothetical protein
MHSCCTRGYNRCRSYNGTGTRDYVYGCILLPKHSRSTAVDGTRQSTASKHRMFSTRSSVCRKQNTDRCRSPPLMTKAPTGTPAFECRPWNMQQRDHVRSSTQLNEMTSCTAAVRAVKTDAAARTEQERATMRTGAFWFTSTYILQPSTAHGKVQHPSTICIRQDHPFVESKTRTDADHHRR